MNEVNERNQENIAPETAENTSIQEQEAAAAEVKPEAKPTEKAKKGKKKRKRAKISLVAAALLLVIALLFGMVVGYGMGRNVGAQRLKEAEAQVLSLTAAFEEISSMPVYDAFDEELTGENQNALSDLAGSDFSGDDVSEQLGEDALLGEMLEAGEAQQPVVVAEYKGGKLMSDEVALEYEERLTELVFAGYSEEEVAGSLLNEVLEYMVGDRILEAKAKEMGVYELTDADRSAIEAEAEAIYNEQLDFYRAFVDTAGMSTEEANGAVKNFMQESEGTTLESIRAELEESWWAQKAFDEITKDVTVDEAALQKAYDELLAQQKDSYELYADDYEFEQMSGEVILYNLPGYRAVRSLLVGFEDAEALEAAYVLGDEINQLDPEKDAELIAEYRAELDGYYAALQPEAQALLDQLNSGADFGELLKTAGDDSAMQEAPLNTTGYYVSEDSVLHSPEMISAALALEKPGDISGLVRVPEGICILEYVGDVQPGAVALESVRDALLAQTLDNAKYAAYEKQMHAWLEEADAVYYPERMQ